MGVKTNNRSLITVLHDIPLYDFQRVFLECVMAEARKKRLPRPTQKRSAKELTKGKGMYEKELS
ncbi:hypothetical protein BN137_3863 [Cronobacter condimenti 1330]|uniref:Uncharacterized protein n=1 Tax=Cronobacter condimenti 1330 TaxID=1073999 RepID=K8A481_9ENTR|nr:hypothetical protein BN137_3863 [Cronobacter condimenti 1330]